MERAFRIFLVLALSWQALHLHVCPCGGESRPGEARTATLAGEGPSACEHCAPPSGDDEASLRGTCCCSARRTADDPAVLPKRAPTSKDASADESFAHGTVAGAAALARSALYRASIITATPLPPLDIQSHLRVYRI